MRRTHSGGGPMAAALARVTVLGAILCTAVIAVPAALSTTDVPPASSVMWGMDDNGSSISQTESGLHRRFALVREFRRLDQSFVDSRMTALANNGRSLVVSVKSKTEKGYIKYAAITAGRYDKAFLKGFAALTALKTRPFFIFQHEPDSTDAGASCTSSTAKKVCGPQFIAAWDHVYNLAKSHGYQRPIFTWTVTNWGFNRLTGVRNKYYWPGNSKTDWVGVDAYSGDCTSRWHDSFHDIMSDSIAWLQTNAPRKKILIPEYGATEGSSATAKPDWFKAIPAALVQPGYTRIKGLVYWNGSGGRKCNDFQITTSLASYKAYKALGLTSAMQMPAPT
ncbi:MAG: hypothetical protein ACJ735_07815 [Actinomycetes bacterium]